MSKIKIWFRAQGGAPEVIDRAGTLTEARGLLELYAMTYRRTPGKLWTGERGDEPMPKAAPATTEEPA